MGKLTAIAGAASLVAAAVTILTDWPPRVPQLAGSGALLVLALVLFALGARWDRTDSASRPPEPSTKGGTIGILDQGTGTVITDNVVSGFDNGIVFRGHDAQASRNSVDSDPVRVIELDQGFIGTDGINRTVLQQTQREAFSLAVRGIWDT